MRKSTTKKYEKTISFILSVILIISISFSPKTTFKTIHLPVLADESTEGIPYVLENENLKYDVSQEHIVINQICGATGSSSATHGFIELYNPTEKDIDLTNWSVQYKSSREGDNSDAWVKCDLKGTIFSHCSYLIRCKQANSNGTLKVPKGDVEWDISVYTKGVSAVLLNNQKLLEADAVPFDNTKMRPTVEGYVDMIAVSGNDSLDTQKAPAYEKEASDMQSKKKAVRRVNFQDTDNNSTAGDLEVINYDTTDIVFIEWAKPKNTEIGVWEATDKPAPSRTTLYSDKPNTLTNTTGEDASTTRIFTWQMPSSFKTGYISIYSDETAKSLVVQAEATVEKSANGMASVFRAYVSELKAGTTYYYTVVSDSMTSKVYSFKTYDNGKFTFVHASDTQALTETEFTVWGNAIQTVYDTYNPDFIIETGDLINTQDNEDEWRWFFGKAENILNQCAFYAVVGNHEQSENYDAVSFREHFTMGNVCTGEGVTPGTVYSYNYGQVHFVVINTENQESLKEQALWTDKDIKNADKKFNILLTHRGIYGARGIEEDVFDAFENVINDNNVDLVLFGHDHSYIRSTMKNGEKSKEGTVHLESGGSGVKQVAHAAVKPSYAEITADPGKPAYSVITVTNNEIIVKTITVDKDKTIASLEECKAIYKADKDLKVDFTIKSPVQEETTEQTTSDNTAEETTSKIQENKAPNKVTLPNRTKVLKVKKAKKSIKVTLKKIKASGYEIRCSSKKKFKAKTTKKVFTKKSVKKIKGLKANKIYYIKARAYVTINKIKYYGKWSPVKRIKTLKK